MFASLQQSNHRHQLRFCDLLGAAEPLPWPVQQIQVIFVNTQPRKLSTLKIPFAFAKVAAWRPSSPQKYTSTWFALTLNKKETVSATCFHSPFWKMGVAGPHKKEHTFFRQSVQPFKSCCWKKLTIPSLILEVGADLLIYLGLFVSPLGSLRLMITTNLPKLKIPLII